MQFGQSVFNRIDNLHKPTIAAVNGFALGGGCELALACDMLLASENAKFGLPEVTLGIHPGFGGTQRLPRLVGSAKAKEMIFTGGMIGAEEALRIGLVNKVVAQDKLMEEAKALAQKILKNGQLAIRLVKSAINAGLNMPLENGLAYEAETQGLAFATEDKNEGLTAFLEKRKPDFKGK
jgi:enoyl-CoA hydratase